MFGGIDPSKIQGMMKKMGISQTELMVRRVIFEMDDKNLVIEEPNVIKIKMNGQESYQVTGEATEQTNTPFTDEDVLMVAKQTGKSQEEARDALVESEGDIASAIMALKH